MTGNLEKMISDYRRKVRSDLLIHVAGHNFGQTPCELCGINVNYINGSKPVFHVHEAFTRGHMGSLALQVENLNLFYCIQNCFWLCDKCHEAAHGGKGSARACRTKLFSLRISQGIDMLSWAKELSLKTTSDLVREIENIVS